MGVSCFCRRGNVLQVHCGDVRTTINMLELTELHAENRGMVGGAGYISVNLVLASTTVSAFFKPKLFGSVTLASWFIAGADSWRGEPAPPTEREKDEETCAGCGTGPGTGDYGLWATPSRV